MTLRNTCIAILLLATSSVAIAEDLGTDFTYQGHLQFNNTPANGIFDFQLALYAAPTGGTPIGSLVSVENITAVDGVFTLELDFGALPFDGDQLWLNIGVREGASIGSYTGLAPRQKITATPYALHSEAVAVGAVGSAEIADGSIGAVDLNPSQSYTLGGATINGLTQVNGNFTVNGGGNFYVNNGKVGIGVALPLAALEVKDSNTSFLRMYTATTGTGANNGLGIGIYDSDKSVEVFNAENGDLSFGTNSIYRMRILANGNIYISKRLLVGSYGDASAGLHVKGASYPDSFIYLESNVGQDAGLRLYEGSTAKWHIFNSATAGGLQIYNTGIKTAIFAKQSNSYVGIGTTNPTYPLHVNGDAAKSSGTTAWVISSDRRLKNIHGNYEKGLFEIVALQPIKFSYKEDNPRQLPSDSELVGFVAQDVQRIFPEAVSEAEDGYLDFNIHAINVAMVNAIKELKLQNGELVKQVGDLESRLEKLEAFLTVKDVKGDGAN